MNFRFAEESDLPALMALINQAFKVEAFFIVRDRLTSDETHAYFQKGRFLLAEETPHSPESPTSSCVETAAILACSPSIHLCRRPASATV